MIDLHSGDILVGQVSEPGDTQCCFDMTFMNGQPVMTRGFGTFVLLCVFGDKNTWQNSLATSPEEKYISDFNEVVSRTTITESTKNDGIQAIKRALKCMTDTGIARKVDVAGQIISVFAVKWDITITRNDGSQEKHAIKLDKRSKWDLNWESYAA